MPKGNAWLNNLRVFSGTSLKEIAFPIGGIGTGTVSLGGRGELRDWEIFNRPGKGTILPFTFFALRTQIAKKPPITKVLESPPQPPYTGASGYDRLTAVGLPHLSRNRFIGAYPFAWVEFEDSDLPIQITLEAFNPFIPLNDKDSGLPVVILKYRLKNLSRQKIKITLIGSIFNPVGFDGKGAINGRRHSLLGKNVNEFVREKKMSGLRLTTKKYLPTDPHFGSMALVTDYPQVIYLTSWSHGEWWDDFQSFWDQLVKVGHFSERSITEPSPDGESLVGSLGVLTELKPGQKQDFNFYISWHFPWRVNDWNQNPEVRGRCLQNFFATIFKDALEVADYTINNLKRLERETRLYQKALFDSTFPPFVLDALSSNSSIIRTTTCFRTGDGKFFGFEGSGPNEGCCPMNCTHVWNYEQTLAYLFPPLERTMREVDFQVNTRQNGNMAFRTLIPLDSGILWKFKPAADGQIGSILKLYREWKLSGDHKFLKNLWPKAQRALEFAWRDWDPDKDGVMTGEQHNTYDIEFYGPNTMIGTLYLAALRAAEEMAEYLGDNKKAQEYRTVYEKGRGLLDKQLWNGEYYIQKVNKSPQPKYQYGKGCLSDQLLGQWWAWMLGLGELLPKEHLSQALKSIFRYNWQFNFYRHCNCQRIYALNDEQGLLLCTWPKGGRPDFPMVYADEVWTGIEYQVAASLIYAGLIKEGLTIVKGLRERYDGARRNPWNEVECGNHYVRALSSWSLLIALSGFQYSAAQQSISFIPKISQKKFQSFWSCSGGWGTFRQEVSRNHQEIIFTVLYGEVTIKTFIIKWAGRSKLKGKPQITAYYCGEKIPLDWAIEAENLIRIEFTAPLHIICNNQLKIEII